MVEKAKLEKAAIGGFWWIESVLGIVVCTVGFRGGFMYRFCDR
jgi:hypothetical protein